MTVAEHHLECEIDRLGDEKEELLQRIEDLCASNNMMRREFLKQIEAIRIEAESNQAKAIGLARVLGDVTEQLADMTKQRDEARADLATSREAIRGLMDEIGSRNEQADALRTCCAELETAISDVNNALREMPELILANERKNPAWSKAELWGIERDIIPSIRLLCMRATFSLTR